MLRASPKKRQERRLSKPLVTENVVSSRQKYLTKGSWLKLPFLALASLLALFYAKDWQSSAEMIIDVDFYAEIHTETPTARRTARPAPKEPTKINIEKDLIDMNPVTVWRELLESPGPLNSKKIVIEVGVHKSLECIRAAEMGYWAHCFEPSPISYQRLLDGIKSQPADTRSRVTPHQKVVGSISGDRLPFRATGGTGDHVGEYDMWNMEKDHSKNEGRYGKRGKIIQMPTKSLDDFIANDLEGDKVHMLKIDVQGFEPEIFSGMEESIEDASIDYIIFEFWPRGMDLHEDTKDQCSGHKNIDRLVASGYTLYALAAKSLSGSPASCVMEDEGPLRPFENVSALDYCRWFFELEEKYPSKDYKYGYWSDFLAVAPGKTWPGLTVTDSRQATHLRKN